MLLPLVMGTVLYNYAYKMVEQKELDMQTLQVNNSMVMMDQTMEKIDTAIIDMSRSSNLNKLLYLPKQPGYRSPEASLVYSAYQDLYSYTHSIGLDNVIEIYINNCDLVFDGRSIVYGQENYYSIGTSYEGMRYKDFKEKVLDTYHFRDTLGGVTAQKKKDAYSESHITQEDGFLYLNSLPLIGSKNRILGTAVVHISSQISNVLGGIPASEYGSTYITDSNQNLLFGLFPEDAVPVEKLKLSGDSGSFYNEIGGQKMLVSFTKSSYNGWYYISASPIDKVMEGLKSLQYLTVFLACGVLLFGFVLSIVFSRKNSKPIEDALGRIQNEYGKAGSTAADLDQSLTKIISDNKEMQKSLERQKIHARGSFFDSLIRGEFSDDTEILQHGDYYGISLKGSAYRILLVTFGSELESSQPQLQTDIAHIITSFSTKEQEDFRAFHHTQSPGKQVILLCFKENDEKKNKQITDSVAKDITGEYEGNISIDTYCFAGQIYKNLSDVCISYSEAAEALEAQKNMPVGQQATYYYDSSEKSKNYLYPAQIETKLRLLATGGDQVRTQEILNYLYEENFVKSRLSRHAAYAFLSDLYLGILSISAKSKQPELIPSAFYKMRLDNLDIDKEFENIRICYSKIAESSAGSVPEKNLIYELETFIQQNFHNPEISIAYMSQKFHVSETYFPQFFKRSTGQIFSKYVETLRINKACTLLREGKETVDEIAAKTGYTSALSFRRAFKKVMGVSPSVYRQKQDGVK